MRASILAAVLLSSACTVAGIEDDPLSGDGTTTPTPDSDPGSDPDPDPDPGAGPPSSDCPPSDLGTLVDLKDPYAVIDHLDSEDPDSPAVRLYFAGVDEHSQIEVGLWDGFGGFAESPAAPGSYPIAGEDADPTLCGLCIELTVTTGDVERHLFATGGAVDVGAVDTLIEGSGTAVSLEEIDDDKEFVDGGCRALIDRVEFSAPLESP